jgi:hypothetical protein
MKTLSGHLIVTTVIVCILEVLRVFPCQCFPLPPIYQAFDDADAVFIGRVTGSNLPKSRDGYLQDDVIFDIEVIDNFKGVAEKNIKLNRGSRSSSCYSGYSSGETYLFYADKSARGGFFEDKEKSKNIVYQGSFCNRTRNVKSAQDQIFYIKRKLEGKPEPQVYGSIARSDRDITSLKWRYTFLEGVTVLVDDGKNSYKTVTDKDGKYEFTNIPAGEYSIKPMSGDDYTVYFPGEEQFTVLPNKKVVSINYLGNPEYKAFYGSFSFGWSNRIEGRVVDIEGKPLERYAIDLLPLSLANSEIATYVEGSPDSHGQRGFWSTGNTPGKYVLAVDIYAPFSGRSKQRVYYPNVEVVSNAKIFDVSAATKISNLEFKVPFALRFVNGEFFWSDGKPIESRNWVEIKLLEDDDKNNVRFDWSPGEKGRFTIQVFEGFVYWIFPEVYVDVLEGGSKKRISLKGKPQKIKAGKEDVSLKIVLDRPLNLVDDKTRD